VAAPLALVVLAAELAALAAELAARAQVGLGLGAWTSAAQKASPSPQAWWA